MIIMRDKVVNAKNKAKTWGKISTKIKFTTDHTVSKIAVLRSRKYFFRLRRAVNPNRAPTQTFVRPLDPEPAPGGNLITVPTPRRLKY
jgi:hypothetical protein